MYKGSVAFEKLKEKEGRLKSYNKSNTERESSVYNEFAERSKPIISAP